MCLPCFVIFSLLIGEFGEDGKNRKKGFSFYDPIMVRNSMSLRERKREKTILIESVAFNVKILCVRF